MTIRIGTPEFGTTALMMSISITRTEEFFDDIRGKKALRVYFRLPPTLEQQSSISDPEHSICLQKDHLDAQRILSGEVDTIFVTVSIQPPIEET